VLPKTRARLAGVSARCQGWVDSRPPETASGVAVAAWRRYRAVDGPLETALLALYIMIAVLPALLVMTTYLETSPSALTQHMVEQYHLSPPTAGLLQSVLAQERTHELGSALFAVAGALFFGLGFGRVLQLVHARSWKLELPVRTGDQWRYAVVLCGFYGLLLLLLVQLSQLTDDARWARLAVAPGWVVLLIVYFVWAPRLLTHGLISRRDLLPSAAVTALGIVGLMLISSYVMEFWVNLYSRDYGGLGVVMAIFFWLAIFAAIIVAAAALAPALADRRELHNLDPDWHSPLRTVRRSGRGMRHFFL